MFGPSPYIGVLSPEQRPWRRSCHHRSVVGVHPRIGWRAAFSTRCHLFGCDSGLSAMRLWPTSVWRAHRIWWWMILAPIFLGEPRLCTQKMVVRARTWRGLHQPGVGCHPAVCARSLLVCLQLWVLTLLGPPMALRQILFGFILSSPVSFETTRSFGRSSPPLRLSNPESPERPLGIR